MRDQCRRPAVERLRSTITTSGSDAAVCAAYASSRSDARSGCSSRRASSTTRPPSSATRWRARGGIRVGSGEVEMVFQLVGEPQQEKLPHRRRGSCKPRMMRIEGTCGSPRQVVVFRDKTLRPSPTSRASSERCAGRTRRSLRSKACRMYVACNRAATTVSSGESSLSAMLAVPVKWQRNGTPCAWCMPKVICAARSWAALSRHRDSASMPQAIAWFMSCGYVRATYLMEAPVQYVDPTAGDLAIWPKFGFQYGVDGLFMYVCRAGPAVGDTLFMADSGSASAGSALCGGPIRRPERRCFGVYPHGKLRKFTRSISHAHRRHQPTPLWGR